MAEDTRGQGQSVTARALALLGAFDAGHPRLTLSELARRSDLPLATAHRLAQELEAWRALERDPYPSLVHDLPAVRHWPGVDSDGRAVTEDDGWSPTMTKGGCWGRPP